MQLIKRNVALVSLILLILTFAVSGWAQTSKGIIAGTITDNTGAVVVGAEITATNLETGEARTVQSGPTGAFRIDAVNPGKYKAVIAYKGFRTETITDLAVSGSIVTPVDVRLQIKGTDTTEVTVVAENNQVETENGQLSGTITTKELTELPIGSLNPIELALTEPGVTDNQGRGGTNGVGFSVNGSRPQSNNFLIDGQDNNDNAIQGQAFQPQNPNAIQEVAILTNSYSAEFGRGGASVTNIIYKSGSNAFHGTASEYYQGSGLNAIDASAGLTGTRDSNDCNKAPNFFPCKTRYDEHIYGFTVGGPIVKNKLFFFASSVWERFYGNESSTMTLPTDLGVSQLQAYGSPNAQLLLKYIGNLRGTSTNLIDVPTGIATLPTVQMGSFTRIVPQSSPDTQWNFKVDYLPSQKDTISFRYLHDRSSFSPDWFADAGSNLPNFETYQGGPSLNGAGTWTHTFTPNLINEFRFSYGHFNYVFYPTAGTAANPLYALPGIGIGGIPDFPLLGTSSGFPQGRSHKTWQGQDGLTKTFGKHTLKVGADVAKLSVVDAIPIDARGTLSFSQGGGYTALGNFLDNFTGTSGTSVDKVFGSQYISPTMWQTGYYAQDAWKLLPNLTIDLGIRYEYQTNPENLLAYPAVNAVLGGTDSTFPTKVNVEQHFNHFAPRVGFAYTPHFWPSIFGQDKTVLRGGFGIFYDSIYTNIMDNSAATSPNAVDAAVLGASAGGRGYSDATGIPSLLSPTLSPYSTVQSVASNLTNPRTTQWNLDIERELPANLLLTVAYVGARGQKLLVNDDYNPEMGWTPYYSYAGRYNPDRGAIALRTNGGDSYYHGLDLKVERKFAHGVMVRSSYTFSKSIDDGSNIFVITGGSSYAQDVFNRASDRGLSAFNATHRWATTWAWDIPGLRPSGNGFANALGYLTRHWEWTGTLSLQSGLPQTVYSSFDFNGDGHPNDRPDLMNASAPMYMVAASGYWYGDAPNTYYDWATNQKLTSAQLASYHWYIPFNASGNVGRNSYIQPGSINTNFGITRVIPIPRYESQSVQIRFEMYNPFNHPNENGDPGLWTNNINAVLPGTASDPNPAHLFDPYWARNGARNMRFLVKYTF